MEFEYKAGDNMTKKEIDDLNAHRYQENDAESKPESIHIVGFTNIFNGDAHILTLPNGRLPKGDKSHNAHRSVERDAYDIAKSAGLVTPSSYRSLHIEREQIERVHGYSFQVVMKKQSDVKVLNAVAAENVANFITNENIDQANLPLELHLHSLLVEETTHRFDKAYLRAFGETVLNLRYL